MVQAARRNNAVPIVRNLCRAGVKGNLLAIDGDEDVEVANPRLRVRHGRLLRA